MADTAVHIEQHVLPRAAVRHWTCSLPWRLRVLCGYDSELCAGVIGAFVDELSRSLKRRAKRLLGLSSVAEAHTGAVAAIQRTDSALRLNVHGHVVALDGVYLRDDKSGELVFHALPTPTPDEVAAIAERTARRIERLLVAQGRSLDPEMQMHDEPPQLAFDEPALAACYQAAAQGLSISGARAGQPTLRLVEPLHGAAGSASLARAGAEAVAIVRGVNVHAGRVVDGRDRKQLERLLRYLLRPPLSQERLELRADGRIELTFKRVWRDGTRALLLEPDELLSRLVAAVPPPRQHQVRYYGVLSSHSKLRAEIVPKPEVDTGRARPPQAAGDQLELLLLLGASSDEQAPRRNRWGWLLRHVFAADLDTCARCGGAMRWVEVATDDHDIARLLAEHDLAPRAPPLRSRFVPEQLELAFSH